MSKIFLCGITDADALEDVKKNILPIAKYFDGINWVVNFKSLNKGTSLVASELAKANMKGSVCTQPWFNRYDFARNRYLFDSCMKDGDFFMVLDSLETVTPEFIQSDIPKLIKIMNGNQIDALYLHGKLLFAIKREWQYYANAIHEQLQGVQRAAELTQIEGYEDSDRYFTNTRPETREEFHFVNHFLKYYTYSSIQCLMGAEGNEELYQSRAINRHRFKQICNELEIEFSVEGILAFWKNMPVMSLTEDMLECINKEKILNDAYRYNILGDKDLTSDWNFDNIKKI